MKLFELQLELRTPFDELSDLFLIFNQMVISEHRSYIYVHSTKNLNVSESETLYLGIKIYRCMNSYASLGIKRDLVKTCITEELIKNLKILHAMHENGKPFYPLFSSTGSSVKITIYDSAKDLNFNSFEIEDSFFDAKSNAEFLNLDFYIRKPFLELTDLVKISNKMFKRGASSFIRIRPSSTGSKSYLNLLIFYKESSRPSLYFNIGLLKDSVPLSYYLDLTKYNLACSQTPSICEKFITLLATNNKDNGPIFQIHVNKTESSKEAMEKIEEQCKLLDSISPQ